MANDLSAILPKILARGLLALRQKCIMPLLVNGDYSNEAAQKGDTIDVPISNAIAAIDVAPGTVPVANGDNTPGKVQVQLNNWKQNTPFYLTDQDMLRIDMNATFLPLSVQEAVKGLARAVNQQIWGEYKGVYGCYGTPGATPFATTVLAATQARMILNQQLCPKTDRRAVLDYTAEANMLALPAFSDAQLVGSAGVKVEGEIGRKYGIDWYSDDDAPYHTKGGTTGTSITTTATPTDSVAGTYGVGGSVPVTGVTATFVVGDIFTVAGDTQTYTVQAVTTLAANAQTLTFYPRPKVSWTSSSVVTVTASHRVNLAFHREAFAFATRPLLDATQQFNNMGSRMMSLQDPQTGLVLRLEVSRQHKQVAWEFDILWGCRLVRPDLAVRIFG